jgi:hypothetical protein
MLLVVATIVPLILPVLILTVNDSAPSVVLSAVGVTVKLPALLVIVNDPEFVEKSLALLTVQYNVVLLATFVVVTLIVTEDPSFTLPALALALYVDTIG